MNHGPQAKFATNIFLWLTEDYPMFSCMLTPIKTRRLTAELKVTTN
jgi:hypothetical protein